MTFRIRVGGVRRLERRVARLNGKRRARLSAAVEGAAETLRSAVKRELARPGVEPSRPGMAPRRRSGRLVDSVTIQPSADGLGADVGSDLDYGRFLEFGTRRMAARPWLLPSFIALKEELRAQIRTAAERTERA